MTFASVLLILAFALQTIPVDRPNGVQPKPPRAEQAQPSEQQNNDNNAPSVEIQALPLHAEELNADNHESGLEKATWWLVYATIGLVAVGIVASIIAIMTLGDIRDQTASTEVAAHAALLNAQAVLNSERAWVFVELEWNPVYPRLDEVMREDGSEDFAGSFRLKRINQGKTPAWITQISACLSVVTALPTKPEITQLELIDPVEHPLPSNAEASHPDFTLTHTLKSGESPSFGRMVIVWGIVEYRDIFAKVRRTFFGYRVGPDAHNLMRLISREYNRNE